jgi:hypothetical protein
MVKQFKEKERERERDREREREREMGGRAQGKMLKSKPVYAMHERYLTRQTVLKQCLEIPSFLSFISVFLSFLLICY